MSKTGIARALRKKSTWAEKRLWKLLRDRRFAGFKFRRQHPVGPHYLDFYCPAARLSIELDGRGHGHPMRLAADKEREAFLAAKGIRTIRFWNHALRDNLAGVREVIWQALHNPDWKQGDPHWKTD